MSIVLRFAPSPTGELHIGGARTALINDALAKLLGGIVKLRIEDTDIQRSRPEHVQQIIDNLRWLGILPSDISFQSDNIARHLEVARHLVQTGKAYYCQCCAERLAQKTETYKNIHAPHKYDGACRDKGFTSGSIRLKLPAQPFEITHQDIDRKPTTMSSLQLDDYILVRQDMRPTFMLSSVVDDMDMKVTHIVRGCDHYTNTIRQAVLWQALEHPRPQYLHLGLIHDREGNKLSKRNAATGLQFYRDQGYLPQAMQHFLLTLGWLPGDTRADGYEQLTQSLKMSSLSSSSSKLDEALLKHINQQYLNSLDRSCFSSDLADELRLDQRCVHDLLDDVLPRSTTTVDVKRILRLCLIDFNFHECDTDCIQICRHTAEFLNQIENDNWEASQIAAVVSDCATASSISKKTLCGYLRLHLTNSQASPSLFKICQVIGKHETIKRLTNRVSSGCSGAP